MVRVLIADDHALIRSGLMQLLQEDRSIREMGEAATGEQTLDRLRESRWDLLLLDINMPGLSGLETCRAVRTRSDVGIIMLTVRDRSVDKIEALDAGADGYVTKPFDVNELLARVRATLRRASASALGQSEMLQLDAVEINFRDRQVKVNGRVTRLTPTEQDLLHYLVMHPNTALPHDQILQAVWGPDYGNEVEYLRVFVNQLRKKIEPDPAHPRYILTEPWLGYRFNLQRGG